MAIQSASRRSAGPTAFNLSVARINAGYSIKGFARHLKIHEATLRRLENGQRVRPESAKPVADFFEMRVTELLGIDDPVKAA